MSDSARFEQNENTTAADDIPNPNIEQPQDTTAANVIKPISQTDLEELLGLSETIDTLRSSIVNLKFKMKKFEKQSGKVDTKIKKNEDKLNGIKNDQVQTLAVFVGLFTFISIEFQLFKQAESSYIMPLSLGVGGVLFTFLAILIFILHGKKDFWLGLLIALGILVTGTGVYLYQEAKAEVETNTKLDITIVCKDLKDKIAESTIQNNPDETSKLKATYETLLCK